MTYKSWIAFQNPNEHHKSILWSLFGMAFLLIWIFWWYINKFEDLNLGYKFVVIYWGGFSVTTKSHYCILMVFRNNNWLQWRSWWIKTRVSLGYGKCTELRVQNIKSCVWHIAGEGECQERDSKEFLNTSTCDSEKECFGWMEWHEKKCIFAPSLCVVRKSRKTGFFSHCNLFLMHRLLKVVLQFYIMCRRQNWQCLCSKSSLKRRK